MHVCVYIQGVIAMLCHCLIEQNPHIQVCVCVYMHVHVHVHHYNKTYIYIKTSLEYFLFFSPVCGVW